MKYLIAAAIGLALIVSPAAADTSALEDKALAHVEAYDTAHGAALEAHMAGDTVKACRFMRTARDELYTAGDILQQHSRAVIDDKTLTPAERDAEMMELTELLESLHQEVVELDAWMAERCA